LKRLRRVTRKKIEDINERKKERKSAADKGSEEEETVSSLSQFTGRRQQ